MNFYFLQPAHRFLHEQRGYNKQQLCINKSKQARENSLPLLLYLTSCLIKSLPTNTKEVNDVEQQAKSSNIYLLTPLHSKEKKKEKLI